MTRTWMAAAVVVAAFGCRDSDRPARAGEAPKQAAAAAWDAAVPLSRQRALIDSVAVKVIDPSQTPRREVYPRILAQRLGATLTQSPWFLGEDEPPAEGRAVRRAVVELSVGYDQVPEGSTGEPAIIAVVEATLAWSDHVPRLTPAANVLAERAYSEARAANLDGLVAGHVEQAVADAAAMLIDKERIRVGPPEAAAEALAGDDLDLRIWALQVIGERKLTDAIEPTLARLQSDAEAERDAAIGASIALGDRRAVAALAQLADFHDYALMRRVIEAIAALGGEEALDYLEFVATGHPDDDIQEQARAALDRARRKADAP